jgi:hypothetical protein
MGLFCKFQKCVNKGDDIMRSIFRELVILEQSVLSNTDDYNENTRYILSSLIKYIEQGTFTKSEKTKFICSKFRHTSSELTNMWNNLHKDTTTAATMRSQIAKISKKLYKMFGNDLNTIFMTQDTKGLACLQKELDILNGYDIYASDLFISDVLENISTFKKCYELKECRCELDVIKGFLISNVYSKLRTVDKEKIAYLINILNQPLCYSGEKGLNKDKLKILVYLSSDFNKQRK